MASRHSIEWKDGILRFISEAPTVYPLLGREGMSTLIVLRGEEVAEMVANLRRVADEIEAGK